MENVFEEKRRFPRLTETISLRVKTQEGTDFDSNTINLGGGGAYFQVHRLIATSPTMEIQLVLPSTGSPLSCIAELVRVEKTEKIDEYNWAVRFKEMEGISRQTLLHFLNSRLLND